MLELKRARYVINNFRAANNATFEVIKHRSTKKVMKSVGNSRL